MFANATAPASMFLSAMLREQLRQLAVVGRAQYYNDQYVLNTGLVHVSFVVRVLCAAGEVKCCEMPAPRIMHRCVSASCCDHIGALSHHACMQADLTFNVSLASPDPQLWSSVGVAGSRRTTAPQPLAVLFLPERDVLRQCQATPPAPTTTSNMVATTMQPPPALHEHPSPVPPGSDAATTPTPRGAPPPAAPPHRRPTASLVVHCQSSKSGAEKQAALQQLGLWRPWQQQQQLVRPVRPGGSSSSVSGRQVGVVGGTAT